MTTNASRISEAVGLCAACRSAGFDVRLFGGVAAAIVGESWFRQHPKYSRITKDIDLVGPKEKLGQFRDILAERGYHELYRVAIETEGDRALLVRDDLVVDYSSDALIFAQRLPLRARLSRNYPTLSLTDLVLEKLQVVSPRTEHIVDFLALLCSQTERAIETEYLGSVLGKRWGYWHSALLFLVEVRRFCRNEGLLDALRVLEAVHALVQNSPRTFRWHIRSLFGEVLPWHAPVEPIDDR